MSISKRKIPFYLMCITITFLCLRMESIQYLTPFGMLYLELPILLTVLLILLNVVKYKSFSNIMLVALAYFGVIILSTYLNDGKIHLTLTNICPALCMCLFADYSMRAYPQEYAKCVGYFLSFLILLDLFSIIVYPNGMYSNSLYSANWILGFKTQRANIAIPTIALLATESYLQYNKIKFHVWFIAATSIAALYLCESTAGMVGVVVEIIFFVLAICAKNRCTKTKFIKILLDKWIVTLIIIVIDIMITIFNNVELFKPFIVNTLGKDLSFTGRTVIWASAIILIIKKPIIGSGFLDSVQFINLTGNYGGTQPHNLFLAILVYSGFIGLIIYIYIYVKAIIKSDIKYRNRVNGAYIFRYSVIANLIIGITSMNAYTAFNVASMIILYHYCKIYNLENGE